MRKKSTWNERLSVWAAFLGRFWSNKLWNSLFLQNGIELALNISKPKLFLNFRVFLLLFFLFPFLNLLFLLFGLMKILYKLNIFVLVIGLIFLHALHSFLRRYIIYGHLLFSNVLDRALIFMSRLWRWSLVWNCLSLLTAWHLIFKTLVSCRGWDVVVRGLDSTELLEGLPWKMLVGCVKGLRGQYL